MNKKNSLYVCLPTEPVVATQPNTHSPSTFFNAEEMLHTKIYSKSFCILTHDFICKYEQCTEYREKKRDAETKIYGKSQNLWHFLVAESGTENVRVREREREVDIYLGKLRAELARSWCCLSCFPRSFSALWLVFHLLFLFAKVIQFFECMYKCMCVCVFVLFGTWQ